MGVLRKNAYEAPARFKEGGPVSSIRWFEAASDAQVYLKPNVFSPLSNLLDYRPTDGVGELCIGPRRRRPWTPPVPVKGEEVHGTDEDFEGITPYTGPFGWEFVPECRVPNLMRFHVHTSHPQYETQAWIVAAASQIFRPRLKLRVQPLHVGYGVSVLAGAVAAVSHSATIGLLADAVNFNWDLQAARLGLFARDFKPRYVSSLGIVAASSFRFTFSSVLSLAAAMKIRSTASVALIADVPEWKMPAASIVAAVAAVAEPPPFGKSGAKMFAGIVADGHDVELDGRVTIGLSADGVLPDASAALSLVVEAASPPGSGDGGTSGVGVAIVAAKSVYTMPAASDTPARAIVALTASADTSGYASVVAIAADGTPAPSQPTPGSNCSGAPTITLGTSYTYDIGSMTEHWFMFAATGGTRYHVTYNTNSGSGPNMYVYTGSSCGGATEESEITTGSGCISFEKVFDTNCYIKFTGPFFGSGNYTFTADTGACP